DDSALRFDLEETGTGTILCEADVELRTLPLCLAALVDIRAIPDHEHIARLRIQPVGMLALDARDGFDLRPDLINRRPRGRLSACAVIRLNLAQELDALVQFPRPVDLASHANAGSRER